MRQSLSHAIISSHLLPSTNASLSTHSTPTHMERRKAPPYQLIAGDHYNLTWAMVARRHRKGPENLPPFWHGSSTRTQTGT